MRKSKFSLGVALACAAAIAVAVGVSHAQQQVQGASAQACRVPAAPVVPDESAARRLSGPQITALRAARDAYFVAADEAIRCLDAEIETRMRAMFSSGNAMDDSLRSLGLQHQNVSKDRALVFEKTVRACIAWENVNGALQGGCIPAPVQTTSAISGGGSSLN